QAAIGGFAADTGVDYTVGFVHYVEALFEQGHPAPFDRNAVGRTQTVAKNQDGGGRCRGRTLQARPKKKNPSAKQAAKTSVGATTIGRMHVDECSSCSGCGKCFQVGAVCVGTPGNPERYIAGNQPGRNRCHRGQLRVGEDDVAWTAGGARCSQPGTNSTARARPDSAERGGTGRCAGSQCRLRVPELPITVVADRPGKRDAAA